MNDVEYVLRIVLKARDEMAKVLAKARAELIGFTSAAKKGHSDIDGLNTRISSLNRRMGNLIDRFDAAGAAIHHFASRKKDADDLLERNVRLMGQLGDAAKDMGRGFRNASGDTDRLGNSTRRSGRDADEAGNSFTRWVRTMRNAGDNIATLDNRVRGIGLLLVAAFAQQLITVLVGLGGEFVALGSSALMAGGAIGGGFAAGIAQAIPVLALLGGAIHRVTMVMQAFQLQQKLNQAQFVDQQKKGDNVAKSTNQVANAQDSLLSAYQRVSDAQAAVTQAEDRHRLAIDKLNDARKQARRDIEDLIIAEKRADLAARGAALSQRQAQEELRKAVLGGGSTIDVDRATLGVADAQLSREEAINRARRQRVDTRVAVRGGIEHAPNVEDAKKAAQDAARSVSSAVQNVKDAERAVKSAQRGLEDAKTSAVDAGGRVQTAAANLNFFLTAELTKAERRLYDSVVRIQQNYKRLFRPITDIIVDAFTGAVDRVDKVMQMPSVLATAHGLAKDIGASITQFTSFLTSDSMVAQFIRITNEARNNLAPLTTIAIRFTKSFANIAEAAGPAFRRFIDFIGRLSDRFEHLTQNKQGLTDFFLEGEKHFEAWIELGLSIVKLFFAISQAGGAASGLKTLTDATDAIDGLTKKVNANHSGVAKFFEDARKVTYEVVRVVVALGKELLRSFSPSHAHNFADILVNVVIPALGMVIRGVGLLTDKIANFLSDPVVSTLAKWGVAFLILGQLAASTIGAFAYIGTIMSHFGGALTSIVGIIPRLAPLSAFFADLVTFGPALLAMAAWPIAIVAGIVILLASLGELDNAINAIVGFFTAFWAQLQEPIDRLKQALNDLTGSTDGFGTIIGYLKEIVHILIGTIGAALKTFGSQIGAVFGGAIDVIAGFVKVVDGILHLDFGKVLDGVLDMVRGWANAIKNMVTAPFHAIFGGGDDAKKTAADIEAAAKKVKDAEQDLAKSQKVSAQAQRDLTSARRDARRELSDLASRSAQGRLQVREARFSLQDAQNELRSLKQKGAAQGEIARAELRVEQARQSLKDTTRDAGRAEKDYSDARKKGVKGNEGVVKAAADADRAARKEARDKEARDLAKWHLDAKKQLSKDGKEQGHSFLDGLWEGLKDLVSGIVGFFGDAIDGLLKFLGIKSPSTVFRDIGKSMLDGIIGGFIGFGSHLIRIIKNAIPGVVKAIGGLIKDTVGWLGDKLGLGGGNDKVETVKPIHIQNPLVAAPANTGAKEMEKTRDAFVAAWQDMRNESRRGSAYVEKQYRDMRVNTTTSMDRMFRDIRGSLGDIETSFNRRGAHIEKTWADTWDSLDQATFEGLSYIATQTNKSLDGLGENKISFGLKKPGAKKAVGGVIGQWGQRGKDAVLTWLGRGEAVLNHWQQAAVNAQLPGGMTLGDIVDRVRGFHAGGYEQPGFAQGRAGNIVPIPGQGGNGTPPGVEYINSSIKAIVDRLVRTYHLLITDAYDPTGRKHKSPGHEVTGTAVDFVPGPGGSWPLLERMGAAMVKRGLVVGYDSHIPGAQLWPNHGRGNHIHVEFKGGLSGIVGNLLGLGGAAPSVGRPLITGKGALAGMGQKMLDKIRKAANQHLEGAGGSLEPGKYPGGQGYLDIQGSDSVGKTLIQVWRAMKLNFKALLSAFETGIVESGLRNLPYGDRDSLGWRQERQSLYPDPMNVSHSAQRFYREWQQFNRPGLTAGQVAANVQRPAAAGRGLYDQARGSAVRILQGLGVNIPDNLSMATGGVVPGGDGTPVGLIAHAGEWVVNKFQQSRLAKLLGMGTSSLASMLGFHGAGGKKGYAGGGVLQIGDSLGVGMQSAIHKLIDGLVSDVKGGRNSDQGYEVLKKKLRKTYTDVIFDLGTNDAFAETTAKNLRKAYRLLSKDQEFVISTVHGPDAKNKNKAIREFASKHDNVTVVDWANKGRNLVGSDGIHSSPAGYAKRAKLIADAVKSNDQKAAKAAKTVKDSFVLSDDAFRSLTDLMGDVQTVFGKIRATQQKFPKSVRKFVDLVDKLTSEGGIFDQIRGAIERNVAQRARKLINDRFTVGAGRVVSSNLGGVDVAQRTLDDLRTNRGELVDERDNIGTTLNKVNQQLKRKGLSEPQRRLLQAQSNKLQQEYDDASQRIADNVSSIYDAQQALLDAVVKQQQDAVDEINKRFDRVIKWQDFGKRIASALGNEDLVTAINAQQRSTLEAQAHEIEGQIQAAYAVGAIDLADTLTTQYLDLVATITESAIQETKDTADRVNARASRRLGRLDLANRLLDASGAVGQNVAVGLGGEQFSRAGIFAQRGQVLEGQRTDLQGVLRTAESQGNIALIQDLTDQLAELDVTIKENTKAAFSAKVDALNQSTGFNLGVNDLNKQILELEGQISGNTNQAAILSSLQDRQNILLAQRQGLEALLAEAQASGDQQAVNDLTTAILENRVATLQNTQAINQASGLLTDPQTFTSSAWTLFREAIFTGMGQILPQFDISGGATSALSGSGAFSTSNFAPRTSTTSSVNGGDTNINLYGYEKPVDPTEISSVVGFAKKTSQ